MNMPLVSRLLPLLLVACASAPAAVPEALAPARDEQFALTVAARGVQVYECRAAAGGAPKWAFVAPEAELLDAQGRIVGTHGAGPHWLAHDGSRLQGTVKARAEAPRAGDDIPWLLLATTSSGPQGAFSSVTSIQRVHTAGGLAPATACEAEGVARVPYTAQYRLFRGGSTRAALTTR
jgi:hypothetical protein